MPGLDVVVFSPTLRPADYPAVSVANSDSAESIEDRRVACHRRAGDTNGELAIPRLFQTLVMSFSMSASRLWSIGSTGEGMNAINDRMRR